MWEVSTCTEAAERTSLTSEELFTVKLFEGGL